MAGLQGVGKTTACGKLALYLKGQGKTVSMVATDVYRPAAIDQLVRGRPADGLQQCQFAVDSVARQLRSCTLGSPQQPSLLLLSTCPGVLQVKLGQRIGVPVFELGTDAKPDEIAAQGVAKAKKVQFADTRQLDGLVG